jgi:methyl-accepting chemotaxis protein
MKKNQTNATKRILRLGPIVGRGFGSILLLVIVMGAVSYWATRTLVNTSQWVLHTIEVQFQLQSVVQALADGETAQRGFVISKNEEFIEPFDAARRSVPKAVSNLERLLADNPVQLGRLRELEELANRKIESMSATVAMVRDGKGAEALEFVSSGKGKKIMDDVRAKLQSMTQAESDLFLERQTAAEWAGSVSIILITGGTLLIIGVGIGVMRFVFGRVIQPINEITNTISVASSEIAASVEQHERTAVNQASSVNETTATMEELEASFRQAMELSETSANRARDGMSLTEKGNKTVQQSLSGMTELKDKVGAVAEQILGLSEQIGQIGNITNLVGDLASQTNMLALNAAVEAARAGDHGKGFAVVASEIRKLADQSRRSAEKISTLVADIQRATNTTVMVTEEGTKTVTYGMQLAQSSAEVFNTLTSFLNTTFESAQQIMLTGRQQLTAVRQVAQAMEEVTVGAKETAAGLAQTRAGVGLLKSSAERLEELV